MVSEIKNRKDEFGIDEIERSPTMEGKASAPFFSKEGSKKAVMEELVPVKSTAQPYAAGRDSVQTSVMPYGAGLQTGGYPKVASQTSKTEHRASTEMGKASTPYIAQRDEVKPAAVPYAAGLQSGIKPQSSTAMSKDSGAAGSWQKKKIPSRTSMEIREELERLEERYNRLLRDAEAWESQATLQSTPEKMSLWEKKGRANRKEAAALEPYLDALQKEWEYAMDWEWEVKKKQEGYRDATLWDLTVGSVKRGYNNAQYGIESYRDMMGDEDNRKAEYEKSWQGRSISSSLKNGGSRAYPAAWNCLDSSSGSRQTRRPLPWARLPRPERSWRETPGPRR